jgi:hypothetical protein
MNISAPPLLTLRLNSQSVTVFRQFSKYLRIFLILNMPTILERHDNI